MIELLGAATRALVSPVAAMVVEAEFRVAGRVHRPLARAPWIDEDLAHDLPGHLRLLGGDFVGIPFGSAGRPDELDASWDVPVEAPLRPHGPAADDTWEVVAIDEDRAVLALEYPTDSPIERVERTIALRRDAAALDFELAVHARRADEVALGLHPILRLPTDVGALRLTVDFERGFTYPGRVWPGTGPTAVWREFGSLDAVPAHGGGTVDLSRLPLTHAVEDVVLLSNVRDAVLADFHDSDTRVRLDWDRSLVPHVMLWLSDGVLDDSPWERRYRGLGVEPIAAAFDFPDEVSRAENPLVRRGARTSVTLHPDAPVLVRHSIECLPLTDKYDVKSELRENRTDSAERSQAYV